MDACTGEEILHELCGDLRLDRETMGAANCIPCRMPYIASMFMPRAHGDRPTPVPSGSSNLAFISQFLEIPSNVVFTVEYSVRAAQMAASELMGSAARCPQSRRKTNRSRSKLEALIKAFKVTARDVRAGIFEEAASGSEPERAGRAGRHGRMESASIARPSALAAHETCTAWRQR
jgi:myosin-crossreactive antigen